MEVFQPLSNFYKAIEEDAKINATHISLYFAILQQWNLDQTKNTFSIVRDELMKTAKISSRHTYNKCMNELSEYGYINYVPSLNPLSGSTVHLKCVDLASEILSKNPERRKEEYGK